MKNILGQLKNSLVELLAFFLVVILVLSFVLPVTSLWGYTFNEVLENENACVHLDSETMINQMIAEQSNNTEMKGFDESA